MAFWEKPQKMERGVDQVRIPWKFLGNEKAPAVARAVVTLAEEEGFARSLREPAPLPRKLGRANS